MKNVLILHGGGNDSSGNWFPWLKDRLEKQGYETWTPDLPESENPDQTTWLQTIFSNKSWEFNRDTLLIGHSAGATLILRILENLPIGLRIKKAILISGYVNLGNKPEYFHYKEGLLKKPFDWNKIKNSCGDFVIIASDNDPYDCGEDQARILHEKLGGNLVIKEGQGHFNLEASSDYKEFPELLEYL